MAGAGKVSMNRFYGKSLTNRETEIAIAYVLDVTVKELKEKFGIAASTAQAHVKKIFAKTGVNDRLQLAAWCLREKLITVEEFTAITPKGMYHAD